MRCFAAIVLDDINSDALVDAKPEVLISGMSTLKQAMAAVVDFLESDLKIKNVVFVPFPIMIVPLVRFFADRLRPTADQRRSLLRWFWHCAFTQRYKAGTNTAVMEDLGKMRRLAAGDDAFASLAGEVDHDLFKKTWRINSTAAKATICLLAQFEPRSFLTGVPVNLGTALAAYNAREFHHIYPKAYLGGLGIPFHQSNVIANVCMLAADDNQKISDKAPKDYFPTISEHLREMAFRRALIPREFWDGTKPYADFVSSRARTLAAAAEELIRNGWPKQEGGETEKLPEAPAPGGHL